MVVARVAVDAAHAGGSVERRPCWTDPPCVSDTGAKSTPSASPAADILVAQQAVFGGRSLRLAGGQYAAVLGQLPVAILCLNGEAQAGVINGRMTIRRSIPAMSRGVTSSGDLGTDPCADDDSVRSRQGYQILVHARPSQLIRAMVPATGL